MSSDFVKSGTSLDGEVSYSIGVLLLLIGALSIVNVVKLFVLTKESKLLFKLSGDTLNKSLFVMLFNTSSLYPIKNTCNIDFISSLEIVADSK